MASDCGQFNTNQKPNLRLTKWPLILSCVMNAWIPDVSILNNIQILEYLKPIIKWNQNNFKIYRYDRQQNLLTTPLSTVSVSESPTGYTTPGQSIRYIRFISVIYCHTCIHVHRDLLSTCHHIHTILLLSFYVFFKCLL